jgi:Uma2 family endonuclease
MEHAATLEPYRWRREEFERMVELGLFGDDTDVELLNGLIVVKPRESPEHSAMAQVLLGVLAPVAALSRLRVGAPMWAAEDSEPEPDLAITGPPTPDAHPSTARLAIEVVFAARSAARVKIDIYAAAGVGEYWIVDLPKRSVDVFTKPMTGGYAERRTLRGNDTLAVPEYGIEMTVAEVFRQAGLG